MSKSLSFCTKFDSRERVPSNSGSRFLDTYKMQVMEDGRMELEKTGVIDVYDEINSHAESVDIHVILDRFQKTGDLTLFEKASGFYADITEMPNTYAELLQRVIDAEEIFASLSPDIRAQFNHSSSEFFASIGTEKFNSVFAPAEPSSASAEPKKESEVNE